MVCLCRRSLAQTFLMPPIFGDFDSFAHLFTTALMPIIRKKRNWLESHDYRRHRRRREFWLVLAGAAAFAALISWLLWAMS